MITCIIRLHVGIVSITHCDLIKDSRSLNIQPASLKRKGLSKTQRMHEIRRGEWGAKVLESLDPSILCLLLILEVK